MGTVRFQTSFRNDLNKLYVVQVIDTAYSSDPVLYVAPTPGFSLNYEPDGDKLTNTVMTSRCVIPLYLEANGTSIRSEWDTFVTDLLGSTDETRFQINITEDGSAFWKGIINIEQLSIPDRLYSQIELTATDGFGLLSSKPYNNAGTLYTGWETMIGHLHNALSKLNLGMEYHIVQNWSNGINDTFRYTRCQHDAFKELKDDETLPFDCLSVVKQIVARFQCRIVQRGGAWWVEQYNYLAASTCEIDNYNSSGAYVNTTVDVLNVTLGQRLAGGSTMYREAAKNATVQYAYADSLGGANLFTSILPEDTNRNLGLIPSGNNEVVGFNFRILVAHQKDPAGTVIFRVKFTFTVRHGSYYLSNASGDYLWTTTPATVILYSELKYKDFATTAHIEELAFLTPPTEVTDDMTIEWAYDFVDSYDLTAVVPTGITAVTNIENYAAIVYGVGEINEGTAVTIATSGNGTGEMVESGVLVIGDKPYDRSIGRLQAYDGAEWDNTTGWITVVAETPITIDRLLAREMMAMQKLPVEIKNYRLRADLSVHKKINGYIILTASYDANSNTWDVSGYKPVIDRTGITYVDYTETEQTGSVPGGVNATPTDPVQQYWKRTGTVLSPETDGDSIETTGRVHGNTATFGDETEAGSYVEITTDGHMIMHGGATYWQDLRTPGSAVTPGGAANPTFGTWLGGLRAWQFSNVKMEELFFMVHLPHEWKEGSLIYPHVHWFPTTSQAGAYKVRWGLEYVWINKGETASATTTIYTVDIQPAENPVGYRHYRSDFDRIDGTGKTHSSQLICRLFRDATNVADTLINDAGLLEFDFHIECDMLGSNSIGSKT